MSDEQSENSPQRASLYGPDGKPITSNEPAAEPSEKRSWLARQLPTRNERLALAVGLVIAFGFAGYNYWNDNKDDNNLTPAAVVACDLLNDGETVRFTYDTLLPLLEPGYVGQGYNYEAERAIAEAQAQGCGR